MTQRDISRFILFIVSIAMLCVPVLAATPSLVGLQGTDTLDSNGIPVDGANLTVEIFQSVAGADVVFNETFPSAVNNGSYDILLGESDPLLLEFGGSYYIDLKVAGTDLDFRNITGDLVERRLYQSPLGDLQEADLNTTNITLSTFQNTPGYITSAQDQDTRWNITGSTFLKNSSGILDVDGDALNASYVEQDEYPNLDTDSTNDLETTTAFSGDISGTFNSISLDADTVADNEIDYSQVTLADFINDAGYLDAFNVSPWFNTSSQITNRQGFPSDVNVTGDMFVQGQIISGTSSIKIDGDGRQIFFQEDRKRKIVFNDTGQDRIEVTSDLRIRNGTRGRLEIGTGPGSVVIERGKFFRRGGFGFSTYMESANFPQIYMGNITGAVQGFIDVDNNAPLYLNALDNGPVFISSGGLRPEGAGVDIGTAASRWDDLFIGDVDATGIMTATQIGINNASPAYPLEVSGDTNGVSIYAEANVSAEGFIDRTPFPDDGYDALTELENMSGNGGGQIDHDTLPEFAEREITRPIYEMVETQQAENCTVIPGVEDCAEVGNVTIRTYQQVGTEITMGRDIGASVSINVVAIQQIKGWLERLDINVSELYIDAADDLDTATTFSGDVSGTYDDIQIGVNTVGLEEINNEVVTLDNLNVTGNIDMGGYNITNIGCIGGVVCFEG